MICSFPGEPDPSFFGNDENEEEQKKEGKEEDNQCGGESGDPKENLDQPQEEQKGNVKGGLGIGFWLNAFTITFVVYLIAIMISQRSVRYCC